MANYAPHNTDRRRRLYKLLAVANRELSTLRPGWTDDDYRIILKNCGASLKNGKYSATTLTDSQLDEALKQLKIRGFKVRRDTKNDTWRAPRIAKLNALWCLLAEAGVVRNSSSFALENYCKHRVGLTRLQWATSEQLNKAIEELKQWCNRCNVQMDKQ